MKIVFLLLGVMLGSNSPCMAMEKSQYLLQGFNTKETIDQGSVGAQPHDSFPVFVNIGTAKSLEFSLVFRDGKTNIEIRRHSNDISDPTFFKSYILPTSGIFSEDPTGPWKYLRLEDQESGFIYLSVFGGFTHGGACAPFRDLLKFDNQGNLIHTYGTELSSAPDITEQAHLRRFANGFIVIGTGLPSANGFRVGFFDDHFVRRTQDAFIPPGMDPEDVRIDGKLSDNEAIVSVTEGNNGTNPFVKIFDVAFKSISNGVQVKELASYSHTNWILDFFVFDFSSTLVNFVVNQMSGFYPNGDSEMIGLTSGIARPITQIPSVGARVGGCMFRSGTNIYQMNNDGSMFEFDKNFRLLSAKYFTPPTELDNRNCHFESGTLSIEAKDTSVWVINL